MQSPLIFDSALSADELRGFTRTVAERIRVRIAETPLAAGAGPVPSSVSIGVATYGQHGNDFDVLAKSADRALYAAKAQGRNRVAVFRPDMLAS